MTCRVALVRPKRTLTAMLENLGANEPTGNFHSFEQHQGSIYTIKFKIPNMPIKGSGYKYL
jgi:hypothetical protein